MKNKQLISVQRYQIQSLLQVGTPKKKISELINTSVSTIYGEIVRNRGKRGYTAVYAQEECNLRKERYKGKRKLTPDMERAIKKHLITDRWSPQRICGQAKLQGLSRGIDTSQPFNQYIRNHWDVENSLHWTPDMVFREDEQRKRTKHAAENSAIVRKIALNLLKKNKGKESLRSKRLKAGWNKDYVIELLKF
ncbi:hypothetical protein EZS27_027254 [termite gut metagenome]|uniref:Transposase IS4-like domain-containing protein n=1 Tax=termite gut metagenome TaxID=433724 RepID=A0A5J4QRX3_9ZZZZ